MWIFWWFLCFACGSLPTLDTYPVLSSLNSGSGSNLAVADSFGSEWLSYAFGLFTVVIATFALIGCICCKRHRHPKGFKDEGQNSEQEFKDGHVSGSTLAFENPVSSLELEVSSMGPRTERVSFEPLPLDCLAPCVDQALPPKLKLPYSASLASEQNSPFGVDSCAEWFATSSHVPREKLKYLREIGNGWFGKVVEGRADIESTDTKIRDFRNSDFHSISFQSVDESTSVVHNKAVIVRILTEEATNTEKSWFLGEATPYLKLRHKNILSLLGSCLETDPYLLLFEACPFGDLKGFLSSTCDPETRKSLAHGNVPVRMATDIAAGLDHMHANGFAHTDLAARNCLVTSDLTVKLGDYGTGIEKYPNDYYVVGDRALPIRWAAPESFKCTDTTIETLEVTVKANLWSYAVLLWEIVTWGKKPYPELSDEDVIRVVLSSTSGVQRSESKLPLKCPADCPENVSDAVQLCWVIDPEKRPDLEQVRRALGVQDFDQRWETLRRNGQQPSQRSASLLDLQGSMDSDGWISPHLAESYEPTNNNDEAKEVLSTSFRLGPEEPVKNAPGIWSAALPESGSETEEESWLERIKCGAYTEKVRQKSKSVADLMVLVHIDSDSDADWSLGVPGSEKSKKRLTSTGSDSNLNATVLADEFSEALKKFRNPSTISDTPALETSNPASHADNADTSNVLTLTADVQRRPMLRFFSPVNRAEPLGAETEIFQTSKCNDCDKTLCATNEQRDTTEQLEVSNKIDNLETISTPEQKDILRVVETIKQNVILEPLVVSEHNDHSEGLRVLNENDHSKQLEESNENNSKQLIVSNVNDHLERLKASEKHDTPAELKLSRESQSVEQRVKSSDDRDVSKRLGTSNENEDLEQWKTSEEKERMFFEQFVTSKEKELLSTTSAPENQMNRDTLHPEEHILRLVPKSEPCPPLLRLVPDPTNVGISVQESLPSENDAKPVTKIGETIDVDASIGAEESKEEDESRVLLEPVKNEEDLDAKLEPRLRDDDSSKVQQSECEAVKSDHLTVNQRPPLVAGSHQLITSEEEEKECDPREPNDDSGSKSPPDDDTSTREDDLETEMKADDVGTMDVDDAKRFSTPDDERSSDSGFRDKESCEEEESPGATSRQLRATELSTEEEQLRVIAELNAVLDAESVEPYDLELLSPDSIERKITDLDDPSGDDFDKPFSSLPNISRGDGWFLHPQSTEATPVHRSPSGSSSPENEGDIGEGNDHRFGSPSVIEGSNMPLEEQFSRIINANGTPHSDAMTEDEMACSSGFQDSGQSGLDDSEVGFENDRNGSTESLYSDNSYISFGLDEEYVMAIRKELSEKLPYAQMSVEETPEPLEDADFAQSQGVENTSADSYLTDQDAWNDEEARLEGDSGNVDISIRYNVYNTPLSPILEERESFSIITSESAVSKDSGDDEESVASKQLGSLDRDVDEDLLLVDITTNEAVLLEGDRQLPVEAEKDDQDTLNIDVSDEENDEDRTAEVVPSKKESKLIPSGSAPLPSPEDELKWQQLSLSFPLPMQDDLMSTSFTTKHDWDSQDEDNSSSSGEFVWKEGESVSPRLVRLDPDEQLCNNSGLNDIKEEEIDDENSVDAEEDADGEEDDVEFTPSAWDATLAPHRSALRSPDKTQRQDQKKSVWFKKQRYHCVYEYPKEASTTNNQEQPATNWEPTSYADWEEIMEEPRLDLYPLEYHPGDQNGDEDFYVSSSNRPFQFPSGNGEQVSQFFPGAASALLQQHQHQQLGELRHTRDRLKLNLPPNGTQRPSKTIASPTNEYKPNTTEESTVDETDALPVPCDDKEAETTSSREIEENLGVKS